MEKFEDEIKSKKKMDAHQRASLNIIFTSYVLEDHFGAILKPFDLSEQQYNVLRILRGQNGNLINLKDIQSRMLHKMSNATRLVEKLKLKGFVTRVQCEDNRRKVEIGITNEGLQVLTKLDVLHSKDENKVGKNLSIEEANQLSELLDKFRDGVKNK